MRTLRIETNRGAVGSYAPRKAAQKAPIVKADLRPGSVHITWLASAYHRGEEHPLLP
jgi:hypothetical protein